MALCLLVKPNVSTTGSSFIFLLTELKHNEMTYEYYTTITRGLQLQMMNNLKILGSEALCSLINAKPDPKYSLYPRNIF